MLTDKQNQAIKLLLDKYEEIIMLADGAARELLSESREPRFATRMIGLASEAQAHADGLRRLHDEGFWLTKGTV